MANFLEPKTITQSAEIKGGPQKAVVELGLSAHADELRQARTLLNWRDTRDLSLYLQDFVDGLAHVGKFDLTGMELPMAVKLDGTQVADPIVSILTGHATAYDTVNFIEGRLAMKDIPADHGEALQRPMHTYTKIYAEYHERLAEMAHIRNRERSDLRYQWKRKMLADQDSDLAAANWDEGVGVYYEGYMADQEAKDKEYLPKLMTALSRLSHWQTPVD